ELMAAPTSFIEFTGAAKLDRRTKNLVRRLGPGDVAVIDHTDLDRVSAEELLESGVRVVVNVASSQSGRFPNPRPLLLVRGGVRLIDAPGAPIFDEVSEGELLTVRGASVFRNGDCVAAGRTLSADELAGAIAEQRGRVTEALESFADNTLRYLREEGRLLSEGLDFPSLPGRRGSGTGTLSSLRAAQGTNATAGSSDRTSVTSSRCWSASTGAPTRCSKRATSRT